MSRRASPPHPHRQQQQFCDLCHFSPILTQADRIHASRGATENLNGPLSVGAAIDRHNVASASPHTATAGARHPESRSASRSSRSSSSSSSRSLFYPSPIAQNEDVYAECSLREQPFKLTTVCVHKRVTREYAEALWQRVQAKKKAAAEARNNNESGQHYQSVDHHGSA